MIVSSQKCRTKISSGLSSPLFLYLLAKHCQFWRLNWLIDGLNQSNKWYQSSPCLDLRRIGSYLFFKIKVEDLTHTVWPQPIWKKVRTSWQIPRQHQSTYLGGPESASIEIPPFRSFLWSKFSKIKIFKNFRITSKFFFALQYIKNWTKVVPWKKIFDH